MSKIINRNKHFLDSDPTLKKLIPKEKVFVTCRKNKSIGDILIRNKYKPSSVTGKPSSVTSNPEAETLNNEGASEELEDEDRGCHACGKCYCCKAGYLTPCESFSTFHTDQVFNIKKKITCQSTGLIYLAECISCKISDVGYTTGNLPKFFQIIKIILKARKTLAA